MQTETPPVIGRVVPAQDAGAPAVAQRTNTEAPAGRISLFELIVLNARIGFMGTLTAGLLAYHASLLLRWLQTEEGYGALVEMSISGGFFSFQYNLESMAPAMIGAVAGFCTVQISFILWYVRGGDANAGGRRGWLQLRLMTLIVLALGAAAALYLAIFVNATDMNRGWPFILVSHHYDPVVAGPASTWHFRLLLMNVVFFGMHLLVLGFVVEAWLRYRDDKRAETVARAG